MSFFRRRVLPAVLGTALLTGACAADATDIADGEESGADVLAFDSSNSTAPARPSTTLIAAPAAVLSSEDQDLVTFESRWMCELQRRTFDTPAAIDAALSELLDSNLLARSRYDSFREEVNGDQDLRDAILYAYQETCQ